MFMHLFLYSVTHIALYVVSYLLFDLFNGGAFQLMFWRSFNLFIHSMALLLLSSLSLFFYVPFHYLHRFISLIVPFIFLSAVCLLYKSTVDFIFSTFKTKGQHKWLFQGYTLYFWSSPCTSFTRTFCSALAGIWRFRNFLVCPTSVQPIFSACAANPLHGDFLGVSLSPLPTLAPLPPAANRTILTRSGVGAQTPAFYFDPAAALPEVVICRSTELLPSEMPLHCINCRGTRTSTRYLALAHLLGVSNGSAPGILLLSETQTQVDSLKRTVLLSTPHLRCVAATFDPRRPHGSGAAVIVPRAWTSALKSTSECSGYAASASFSFSTQNIRLISLYVPCRNTVGASSPASIRASIASFISSQILFSGQVFLGGDFNDLCTIADSSYDHWLRPFVPAPPFIAIQQGRMIDVIQQLSFSSPPYTHFSEFSSARLDYLFTNSNGLPSVSNCRTWDSGALLDHKILSCTFNTTILYDKNLYKERLSARKLACRWTVDKDLTTSEQWGKYKSMVHNKIAKKMLNNSHLHNTPDELWESLSSAILKASKCHLTLKRIGPRKPRSNHNFTLAKLTFHLQQSLNHGTILPAAIVARLSALHINQIETPAQIRAAITTIARRIERGHLAFLKRTARAMADKFDSEVSSQPGKGVTNVFCRATPSVDLSYASPAPDSPSVLEPMAVREELRRQSAALFPEGQDFDAANIPPEWSEFFAKLPDTARLMQHTWAPPTMQELRTTLKKGGADKAPGPSGITLRLLRDTGALGLEFLFQLFLNAHANGATPLAWNRAIMIFLAKNKNGYSGSISQMRPIILQEVALKLFLGIFISRISAILASSNILQGASTSVLPGTSVSSSLMGITAAISESRCANRDAVLFLEDKSAAFDSLSFGLIRHSLERINLPTALVNFYCSVLLQNRQLSVATAFGPSAPFCPQRGVPQGGVESPLWFILCYDAGLCALRSKIKPFQAVVPPPPGTKPTPPGLTNLVVSVSSFVDDLAIVTGTVKDAEAAVKLMFAFNLLVGMRTNTSKSRLVCFGPSFTKKVITETIIETSLGPIPASTSAEVIRLLGIFFSSSEGLYPTYRRTVQVASTLCSLMRQKSMAPKRALYVFSSVVMPALGYLCRFAPPPSSVISTINRIIRKTFSHLFGLHKQTPASILHSPNTIHLPLIESAILRDNLLEISQALQTDDSRNQQVRSTLLRLQHEAWSSECLLERPICAGPGFRHHLMPLITLMHHFGISLKNLNASSAAQKSCF